MTDTVEPAAASAAPCASAFMARSAGRRSAIAACARRQFGGFFGPLVTAPKDGVEWTREEPSYFQSSVNIDRGFCRRCGTPLTYRHPGGLEIAIGAFDDRSDLAPQIQVNYAVAAALGGDDLRPAGPSRIPTTTRSRSRSSPSSIPTTKRRSGRLTVRLNELCRNGSLRTLYPEIEPFDTGMLDVGDGHTIYWERVGTRGAKPAVFLHGGPGGTISPKHRRLFDPKLYDVILFDQRGCGKSTPHAEPRGQHDLASGRRHRAAARDGRLRQMAGVRRLLGLDAGARLCRNASGARQRTRRARHLHADQGRARLVLSVRRVGDVPGQVGALHRADPRGRARRHDGRLPQAARPAPTRRCSSKPPAPGASGKARRSRCCPIPRPAASSARTISPSPSPASRTTIFVHAGWLEEGQLLRDAGKLKGIPGVIVHGRYDMPCPAHYAWALHKAWPEAEFHLIEGAGHAYSEPGILDRLIRATDRFAGK